MRKLIAVVSLATTIMLTACGGDSTSPANANIAGSYSLRTIDGSNLPFTVLDDEDGKLEVMNETLVVAEQGTFTQQGSLRLTLNGVVTTENYTDAGTHTRNGTAVTFVFNSDGSSGTAAVSGGTINVTIQGYVLVYRK